ncbi:MAG: epoxide hydrolase [Ferrovibrio sp.]|uniref:epoxide hydrolase family protein n=1 Tax=Ferrovibrio sp. TaxID=1917215 RepID=UPI00262B0009|nr:epoxide hydrolase family protein [Ferrovibrio sp.]MCW0233650.1 epoxide hydrolase [Ferrovibrio sp.]
MLRLAPAAEKFTIAIPEAALADLKQRLARTRFPAEPADAAWQYGSNGAYMRRFIRHWQTQFDWRQWEARLNAFLQYRVQLKRPDTGRLQTIHFLIEPGSGDAPRPLLLTHGWPGSVLEFIDVIEKLAHPERFGGKVEDAFTVICPTLPGYGFSMPLEKPIAPRAIAKLWRDLMVEVLGFSRFLVQAGDWGSIVSSWLGADYPEQATALHLNMVPLRPPLDKDSAPVTAAEKEWIARTRKLQASEAGYFAIQSTKPSTLGFALSDSPAGLAAWFVEKFHGFPRAPAEQAPPFDLDHLIANVALYWLTDTAATSTWMYYAAVRAGDMALKPGEFVRSPTGFLLPPWDLVPPPPKGWLERGYNVTHRVDLERGGHFVAMEQPEAFVADVQDFFRNMAV